MTLSNDLPIFQRSPNIDRTPLESTHLILDSRKAVIRLVRWFFSTFKKAYFFMQLERHLQKKQNTLYLMKLSC